MANILQLLSEVIGSASWVKTVIQQKYPSADILWQISYGKHPMANILKLISYGKYSTAFILQILYEVGGYWLSWGKTVIWHEGLENGRISNF